MTRLTAIAAAILSATAARTAQARKSGRADRDRARKRCTTCHKKAYDCRCSC